MLLSDADLLHYYETKLGLVIGCSCQGNCLRILEDEVICSAVGKLFSLVLEEIKVRAR